MFIYTAIELKNLENLSLIELFFFQYLYTDKLNTDKLKGMAEEPIAGLSGTDVLSMTPLCLVSKVT